MATITKQALASAAKMPPHRLGAWFERHIQQGLKELKERYPIDWLRLYDSKSAGALLPKQPADFIVAGREDVYLLEAKCSGKHRSLRGGLSAMVGMDQAVSHYTWNRAGHKSHFLFLSVLKGELQVWDGAYVAACRRSGTRLDDSAVFQDRLICIKPCERLLPLLVDLYIGDLDVDINL